LLLSLSGRWHWSRPGKCGMPSRIGWRRSVWSFIRTRPAWCTARTRIGVTVTSFTFLGYTFRPRLAKNRWGKHFVSFLPAVSKDAITAMGREIRSWHIARRSDKPLDDLALIFNSIV